MRRSFPLLAACASFACFGAAEAPAGDDDKNKNEAAEVDCATKPDTSDCEDAEAYWTPERMRKAKPLPTPVLDPETLKPVSSD